jgi:glutathione S-transferase
MAGRNSGWLYSSPYSGSLYAMKPKLVSFVLCPYVQRAVIALREKGVDFEIAYIELNAPPAWFTRISPLGKVPLLLVDDEALFESSVILDYLDEVYPPRLHPDDALRRAQHKAWIAFGAELLRQQHELALARDRADFEVRLDGLKARLLRLQDPLERGLFGDGESFSLVDAAYAPLFMRLSIQAECRPEVVACYPPIVTQWANILQARPSIRQSVVPDFSARYLSYLRDKGSWLARQVGDISGGAAL